MSVILVYESFYTPKGFLWTYDKLGSDLLHLYHYTLIIDLNRHVSHLNQIWNLVILNKSFTLATLADYPLTIDTNIIFSRLFIFAIFKIANKTHISLLSQFYFHFLFYTK